MNGRITSGKERSAAESEAGDPQRVATFTKEMPVTPELKNKPLVEAIFEFHWRLEVGSGPGMESDRGFRVLLGRFFDRIRHEYPSFTDLPQSQLPEAMTPRLVRHQFRPGPDKWPLVQIGPGIITVNDTESYKWESFLPRITNVVAALFATYPSEISPLAPQHIMLRYVNAISFNPATSEQPLLAFLREKLHTSIATHPPALGVDAPRDAPSSLVLHMSYPLKKPKGTGVLAFGTGVSDSQPAIIWELQVKAQEDDVPKNPEQCEPWLLDAHETVEDWFLSLCEGELLNLFRGEYEH